MSDAGCSSFTLPTDLSKNNIHPSIDSLAFVVSRIIVYLQTDTTVNSKMKQRSRQWLTENSINYRIHVFWGSLQFHHCRRRLTEDFQSDLIKELWDIRYPNTVYVGYYLLQPDLTIKVLQSENARIKRHAHTMELVHVFWSHIWLAIR